MWPVRGACALGGRGEAGTGREGLASRLARCSPRPRRPPSGIALLRLVTDPQGGRDKPPEAATRLGLVQELAQATPERNRSPLSLPPRGAHPQGALREPEGLAGRSVWELRMPQAELKMGGGISNPRHSERFYGGTNMEMVFAFDIC